MCYFLYLASPLTLSEVRSMLPNGLTADLASFVDQQKLKALHPEAQTVARILAGRCSCDLVRPRHANPIEDERHLRERYRSLGASRDVMVAALARHRRRDGTRPPAGGWRDQLAKFVAEHARNAGPTLYFLDFCASERPLLTPEKPAPVHLSSVLENPGGWLTEGSPVVISR